MTTQRRGLSAFEYLLIVAGLAVALTAAVQSIKAHWPQESPVKVSGNLGDVVSDVLGPPIDANKPPIVE